MFSLYFRNYALESLALSHQATINTLILTNICAVCQYPKQKQCNPPKNTTALPPIQTIGGLSNNILEPGQRVSVDLYVDTATGCLPNTFSKEKIESQFTGGAIFVDQSSHYIFNKHQ